MGRDSGAASLSIDEEVLRTGGAGEVGVWTFALDAVSLFLGVAIFALGTLEDGVEGETVWRESVAVALDFEESWVAVVGRSVAVACDCVEDQRRSAALESTGTVSLDFIHHCLAGGTGTI